MSAPLSRACDASDAPDGRRRPPLRAILARVLPAVLLAATILVASGPWASAERTGSLTSPWLSSMGLSPAVAALLHRVGRKLGHAIAYGLFAVLVLRAVRPPASPLTRRAGFVSLALSVALASADEALQSLSTARGGSVTDVLLDGAGASLALLVAFRLAARKASVSGEASAATDPEAA